MKRTIKNAGVPAGRYEAKFVGTEENVHEEYGDGLIFKFEVDRGEMAGEDVSRVTGVKPTPANACGRFLAALADLDPADGVEIDDADYVGTRYLLRVALTKSGKSTRVEEIVQPLDANEESASPSFDKEDEMPF